MRGGFPHRPDFVIYFRRKVLARISRWSACIFLFIMQIGRMAKNWRTPDAQPSLAPYAPSPFIGRSGILDKKLLCLAKRWNLDLAGEQNGNDLEVLTFRAIEMSKVQESFVKFLLSLPFSHQQDSIIPR